MFVFAERLGVPAPSSPALLWQLGWLLLPPLLCCHPEIISKGLSEARVHLGGRKPTSVSNSLEKRKSFSLPWSLVVRAVPPSPKKTLQRLLTLSIFNGRCNPPQQGLPKHVLIQYLHNIYTSFPSSSSARNGVT
jgi:hypothetical protein